MKINSIQVGLPTIIDFNGRSVTTGINKGSVKGPVQVGLLNIEGDGQADLRVHGGRDKAVYAYSSEALDDWKALRPDLQIDNGSMGENLSVKGLDESEIFVGDLFQVGTSTMLAVQPRMPCYKLAVKHKDPKIIKDFMRLKRPGVYFRVLTQGEINTGDEVKLLSRESEILSIASLFDFITGGDEPSRELAAKIARLKALPAELARHFRNFV